MAQLKENSTVTKNAANNTMWHDNYNNMSASEIIPITGLTDNFSELSVNGKIQASDVQGEDYFGYSVSVSDNRIVIGAYKEDTTDSNAGAVYIFDTDGNELKKIQSSDIEVADSFGYSVSVSNNIIVVGAPYENASGLADAGSAYIFDINGNEIKKIQASDAEASDQFGISVACSENRIVVGARYEDSTASGAGSVYIFDIHGNQISKIQASDAETSDYFGNYVACSDNRIVVGAAYEDSTASGAGSVYIFDLNGNELAKIQASDAQGDDLFGYSVACSDNRIVVGAAYEDSTASGAGAAYIFDLNGNELVKIQASDAQADDYFGTSISCTNNRIVVGAYSEDTTAAGAGAAYIFDIDGNELAKIQASDAQSVDFFGRAVSVSDNRIVVGAHYEDTPAPDAGAAYIFNNFRNDLIEIAETVYNKTGVSIKV